MSLKIFTTGGQSLGIYPHLKSMLLLSMLLFLTIVVYSNSLNNGFVNWDDGENVYENTDIREISASRVKLYFTKPLLAMYTPLVYVSYAIDYKLGGLNPFTYHVTNLCLHLLNIVLLYVVVMMLAERIEIAAVVALLFAVHPMNVGAVAPVSTRGVLLYSFFFLAAFLSYIRYLKNNYRRKYLALTFVLFLMALLSKSAAVVLPLVLLLADYYCGRKLDARVLSEKIPFLVLSLFFGILTFAFREEAGSLASQYVFSLFDRIFLVSYSLSFYLFKVFIPAKLSAYYPYPVKVDGLFPFWLYLSPLVIVTFVFSIVRLNYLRREFIFGTLFFLANIMLVLKIVPMGGEIVCDRYAYLSYIGLLLMIGWVYCLILDRFSESCAWMRIFLIIAVMSCGMTLSFISYERSKVWKDSITLYNDILAKYPVVDVAYNNRGLAKFEGFKDYPGAIEDYNQAIKLNPGNASAFNNRGLAKFEGFKDYPGAIEDYNQAIKLGPGNASAYTNRGLARFEGLKDYEGAIEDYNIAIRLNPRDTMAYSNRGNARIEWKRDYRGAIEDFNRAIDLNPWNALAYSNRGLARFEGLNDYGGAVEDFNKAIKLNPRHAMTFINRGLVKFEGLKDYPGAIEDYNMAVKLNPGDASAYNSRGLAKFEGLKDHAGAIEDYNKAIKLNPGYASAYNNRGNAKIEGFKDYAGASRDYSQAIKLNPRYAMAYNNRGNVKKDWAKDYGGAIEDYTKAIKINPSYMPTYFNRAVLKMVQNDYEGALADYNKVLEMDPLNFMAYYGRGWGRWLISDKIGACADWRSSADLGSQEAASVMQSNCR